MAKKKKTMPYNWQQGYFFASKTVRYLVWQYVVCILIIDL